MDLTDEELGVVDDYDGDGSDDCGLTDEGLCMLAGTEHCDFDCPYRDTPAFRQPRRRQRRTGAQIEMTLPTDRSA